MTRPNLFVDCGAHRGESVRLFRAQFPGAENFDVVCFEPNGDLHRDLVALDPPVEVRGEAVWFVDAVAAFYVGLYTQASTLMAEKTTFPLDRAHPRSVPTIDLARWLAFQGAARRIVVVKLDIEGAEYDVLDDLSDAGLRRIDALYVDYHGAKLAEFDMRRHDRCVERLAALGHSTLRFDPHHGVLDVPPKWAQA